MASVGQPRKLACTRLVGLALGAALLHEGGRRQDRRRDGCRGENSDDRATTPGLPGAIVIQLLAARNQKAMLVVAQLEARLGGPRLR